jgi:hypothetical protein
VHPGAVVPQQEGFACRVGPVDEVAGAFHEVGLDGRHAFTGQRTGVFDGLLADPAETFILGRIVHVGGLTVQNTTRHEEPFHEGIVPGILGLLGLLLGVQVVQVAVELVEAMHGREELVAVAQMVLPNLGGHVTLRFEQVGQGRILGLNALQSAGHPHRGQAGAHRELPGDERRPPRRAARLGVRIGKQDTLSGKPVDIGRLSAHESTVVGAHIEPTDIVGHDQQDVRLLARHYLPLQTMASGLTGSWSWSATVTTREAALQTTRRKSGQPRGPASPPRVRSSTIVECESRSRGSTEWSRESICVMDCPRPRTPNRLARRRYVYGWGVSHPLVDCALLGVGAAHRALPERAQ